MPFDELLKMKSLLHNQANFRCFLGPPKIRIAKSSSSKLPPTTIDLSNLVCQTDSGTTTSRQNVR